jgi:microsomal dipeptidase-like Zn-dependent dipeptidase
MSKAPVILSHGNRRALNPDAPRASTDEAIRKLAKKGGVMGITCIAFMVKGTEPVTIEDVVNQSQAAPIEECPPIVQNIVTPRSLAIGRPARKLFRDCWMV